MDQKTTGLKEPKIKTSAAFINSWENSFSTTNENFLICSLSSGLKRFFSPDVDLEAAGRTRGFLGSTREVQNLRLHVLGSSPQGLGGAEGVGGGRGCASWRFMTVYCQQNQNREKFSALHHFRTTWLISWFHVEVTTSCEMWYFGENQLK